MKVVAVLSVKDEAELIERTIQHLQEIGVDLIIGCDMNSTDGTYEALQEHKSDKNFWVFRLDDQLADDFQTWSRANTALVRSAEADWAIFLDADEYWIPVSGSLKDCTTLTETDVLTVDRFNIPVSADGPLMPSKLAPKYYNDLLLATEVVDDLRLHMRNNPAAVWIRAKAEPKVMARPEQIEGLALGGHDIVAAHARLLRRRTPNDLIIAHLPFSTRSRFRRKVDNIRRLFRIHDEFFGELTAWHWRRWLALDEMGRLDEEFDRTLFNAGDIAEMRMRGAILSAEDLFRERMTTADAPTP
jgi:glycosyltransferase involved in cell wall biosynthesis